MAHLRFRLLLLALVSSVETQMVNVAVGSMLLLVDVIFIETTTTVSDVVRRLTGGHGLHVVRRRLIDA